MEGSAKLSVPVKVVQHDMGIGVAPQFDDNPQALPVGLIANVGDAFHAAFAHEAGDLLHQRGLVHLVGQFGNDDLLAVAPHLLDGCVGFHHDAALACLVG